MTDQVDASLQILSVIADDLEDWGNARPFRGFVARQAKRIREHVRRIDAGLGYQGCDHPSIDTVGDHLGSVHTFCTRCGETLGILKSQDVK